MMKTIRGFTLIELSITLALVVILATTAVAIYTSQILKGRRIDAINALLSISLAEERYRAANTTYGTLAQVWNGVTTTTEGYYTLAISNVTGTSYTITATAVGQQASDTSNGTSCTPLQIDVSNGTVTKTPTACWVT
jgi:type IV pilus assembly protein PilE